MRAPDPAVAGEAAALHLAETRAEWPAKRLYREGSPVRVDGRRQWVTYDEWQTDESDFARAMWPWPRPASCPSAPWWITALPGSARGAGRVEHT